MYNLKVENDLNLPHRQDNHALNKLIRGRLRRNAIFQQEKKALFSFPLLWLPQQFLLDRVTLFNRLDLQAQQRIMIHCNEALLSDFYFLEKSGLAYCAKMILLGETTEIRQLYGLIASDEATHLAWFTPYVRNELRTCPQGKLLPVLGKIIEDCDPNTLYYLVQTLIEGWGFATYKALAPTCQDPVFQSILRQVLRDEAIHHKTGLLLFEPAKVDVSDQFIYERMVNYAEVFRVGPQTIVQCIEKEIGELSLSELELVFSELRAEVTSQAKLHLLKQLMQQPGMECQVQRLFDAGYGKPYKAAQCAKIYYQTRGIAGYVL